MRWPFAFVGIGLAAGIALANPPSEDALYTQILKGSAAMRVSAVRTLVERVIGGNARALEIARIAVLSNDPKVRGPLLEAMIAAQAIERPTAALVPTAAALEKRIRQLLPKDAPANLPLATGCSVTGGTERGATLACTINWCRGACMHESRTITLTTGVRWRIESDQRRRTDDGTCGDCMLIE